MAGVQSIERAFALLRALSVGSAGVTELADRVDLPKSTVSRLLSALEDEGVVEQLESGGVYRLGQTLISLAGASGPGDNLVAAARPYLIDLTDLTSETSGVSILEDQAVYYLEHVETDDQVTVQDWTGEKLPLHCTASGLALLATSEPSFIDAYLELPLETFTANTQVEPALLRNRLAEIRKTGWVWVREELSEGLNSVAAAVPVLQGSPRAALHIHGPSYRFPDETEDRFGRLVVDAAAKLASQLAE